MFSGGTGKLDPRKRPMIHCNLNPTRTLNLGRNREKIMISIHIYIGRSSRKGLSMESVRFMFWLGFFCCVRRTRLTPEFSPKASSVTATCFGRQLRQFVMPTLDASWHGLRLQLTEALFANGNSRDVRKRGVATARPGGITHTNTIQTRIVYICMYACINIHRIICMPNTYISVYPSLFNTTGCNNLLCCIEELLYGKNMNRCLLGAFDIERSHGNSRHMLKL